MMSTTNLSPLGSDHIAISCDCKSPDHVFTFMHDAWKGEEPTVYLFTQLNPWYPWWKRVWLAVKYVFGYTHSGYGHWDCSIMSGENVLKLRDFCDVVVAQNVEYKLGGIYATKVAVGKSASEN